MGESGENSIGGKVITSLAAYMWSLSLISEFFLLGVLKCVILLLWGVLGRG